MFGRKEKKLDNLFQRRAETYNRFTKQILGEIPPTVLTAFKQFVMQLPKTSSVHPNIEFSKHMHIVAEHVRFHEVDLVKSDIHPDGVLLIWGQTEYEEGETIASPNGEHITLTAEQATSLSSPVEVSLPVKLACEGTVSDIVEFLTTAYEEMTQRINNIIREQSEPSDDMEEYLYNLLSDLDNDTNTEDNVPSLDIDLSGFSEEQQRLIRLSHRKTGNTKH